MSKEQSEAEKAAEEWATLSCGEVPAERILPPISYLTLWKRDKAMLKEGFLAGAAWAAPKWVSVKERLPQNSQTVLVYIPFSDMFVGIWSESKNHFVPVCEWVNGRDYDIENIHIVGQYNVATHWQPLPAAPEVGK